jgi:Bacterial Ig-like domain (group 3)
VSASSGSLPTQTVTAPVLLSTATSLHSSLNPSTVGQTVTFMAIVSPSGAGGSPSGSVTFTIDGTPMAPVPLHVIDGTAEATLSLASLAKGTHNIKAAYSGDSSFAASAVASPLVQTVNPLETPGVDGPTVAFVQRFGIHMEPTFLVVHFLDALDPTSAVNLKNYRITDPSGKPVRIKSAVFDAATNSVTLRPAERINLHHTYHFTVIGTGSGGVRNTQGVLLDGVDTGSPGSNYKGTLNWRNVVLPPALSRKYADSKQSKPAGALNHSFLARSH